MKNNNFCENEIIREQRKTIKVNKINRLTESRLQLKHKFWLSSLVYHQEVLVKDFEDMTPLTRLNFRSKNYGRVFLQYVWKVFVCCEGLYLRSLAQHSGFES